MEPGEPERNREFALLHGAHPEHRSTRIAVKVMGVIAASAGVEHGVGQLLQGDTHRRSVLIVSWPDVAAFEPLAGEPAITLIPDLRVSGAITILLSLVLAFHVLRIGARRLDAGLLLALSMLLLLVGGGFRPPLIGLVLGAALLTGASGGLPPAPPGSSREALAHAWRPLLALTALGFLALFPGLVVLRAAAGVDVVWLPAILSVLAFTWLVLTLLGTLTADQELESTKGRGTAHRR